MSDSTQISIQANGDSFRIEDKTPLPEFLKSLDLRLDRVVVELNKSALNRSEAAQVNLTEGDSLEIVRIVAGG